MTYRRVILASVLTTLAASAQETPTQRDAARDVVAKMAALQREVDAAGWAAKLTAPNAARDAVVARARELMDKELMAMSDDITRHPEIGFKETRSIKLLIDYLEARDFDVKRGVAGLETAFVARYKKNNGKPVLGIIVEYDALRGTERDFHGDQHSAQGPVGLAAAIAVAEFLTKSRTAGSVIVYGAPAEEMMPPPSKTVMHEAKVFDEADVLVRSHSSTSTQRPAPGFGTCCLNIDGVKYVFTGYPAHQMTPWDGRNALSALRLFFNNIDALRGTFRPETRIQGIITEGGKAPNVVPDRAVADFYIRYPDAEYLKQVRQLVDDAARGAAAATGTKVKVEHYGSMRDGISVATLNEVAFAYLKKLGATKVQEVPQKPQGYEETGSVSSAIPGVGFSAHSANGGFHTYEMEQDALGDVGHKGFVADAQGMAALLYDFATRPDYRAAVKKEFDGLKALYAEYQAALRAAYKVPVVP
ncbi:MAG TPA: peptidase dimerization domain-containing protein [Gemmatimonadaceae bacterium]|nr:peptidase dimerization domain-containing protein [Gemmatimonadaceae bacterium]